MNNEEIIKNLTERIEVLEKAERKRIIKKRIALVWNLIKLTIIIILLFKAWNYIKPYKEKIDNINEKVDNIEKITNNKLNGLKDYFKK